LRKPLQTLPATDDLFGGPAAENVALACGYRACKAGRVTSTVRYAEDTLVLLTDIGIAFARLRFELHTVQDPYMAATVAQYAGLLEPRRHQADAGTLRSQHVCQKFMGQKEFISLHPIMGHQHPARKTRFERMLAVAGDRLRKLRQIALQITVGDMTQGA
jgi:hypothetical protein